MMTPPTPNAGPTLGLSIGKAVNLIVVAEGLMAKLHELHRLLEGERVSEAYWRCGILPDIPKLCTYIGRKFPEPPLRLLENGSLDRIDKTGLDLLRTSAEFHRENLEPWYLMYVDLMLLRHEAIRTLLDINSHLALISLHQNGAILTTFMDLVCAFVRVNMLADKTPKRMVVQTYALVRGLAIQGSEAPHYYQLCQFLESYDPTVKGLQHDLGPVSPRIGEVLESVALVVFQLQNVERIRSEALLHPVDGEAPTVHVEDYQWGSQSITFVPGSTAFAMETPQAKRKMLLSAALRFEGFLEWIIWGYLMCPEELLIGNGITIALAALKDHFVGTLFRELSVLIHDEYEIHVVSKLRDIAKSAKVTRQRHTTSEARYQSAKMATLKLGEAAEIARLTADASHRLRRTFMKQELTQMTLALANDPSIIGPSIQVIMAALVLARAEVMWYLVHVGVPFAKLKNAIIPQSNSAPVNLELSDPTLGFLLDGIVTLSSLVQKHAADIRVHVDSSLRTTVTRLEQMLDSPGLNVLGSDPSLRRQLSSFWEALHGWGATTQYSAGLAVPRGGGWTLNEVRGAWISMLGHVSSLDTFVSLRQLEEHTDIDGSSSIISEGNHFLLWSRYVDELPEVLSESSSLKQLCYFRPQLLQVFRQTMFGPEGRPQHCCAWLKICSSFPKNAHKVVTSELARLNKVAVECMESFMESIVKGVENLITILDSEVALGSLDAKLLPSQAAMRMNMATRAGRKSTKAVKRIIDMPLPGFESQQANKDYIKTVEAAIQRLTSVCATIGRLEPVQVVNEVFFPKEYLRERVANLFRARILNVIVVEGELQRPTVVEGELRRLIGITNLVEAHSGLDIARSLREVLLSETYETRLQERALTDPPRPKSAWKTIDVIADWYLENIVRDIKGTGVVYAPLHCGFRSTQAGVSHPAELVADTTEIEALVRIFGPYGSDKIESVLKEHIKEMIMRLEVTVRMNKEAFENVVKNMHLATERNKCRSRAEDMEVAMTACIQIGHCLTLRELLSKATAKALKENVPLLFSSIESLTAGIPEHASEPGGTLKLRRIAGLVGAASKADDSLIIVEILNDLATAGESYWLLLPILYAMMMMSPSWRHSQFNTSTGGFNNNVNCLARCIHATIAGVERAGEQHSELQRKAILEMPVQGPFRPPPVAPPAPVALDKRVHSAMRQLIACASVMILGSAWDEENRGPAFTVRVLFLDYLVETSPYAIRSILEEHLPYSILRPILRNAYDTARHEDGPPSDHSHQRKGSLSRTIAAPFSHTSSGSVGRQRTFSSAKQSEFDMISADESNATSGKVRRSSTLRQMFSSASRRSSYDSAMSSGGGERAVDSTADSSEVQTSVRRRSLSVVMSSCTAPRSPPSEDEDEAFSEPFILDSN